MQLPFVSEMEAEYPAVPTASVQLRLSGPDQTYQLATNQVCDI